GSLLKGRCGAYGPPGVNALRLDSMYHRECRQSTESFGLYATFGASCPNSWIRLQSRAPGDGRHHEETEPRRHEEERRSRRRIFLYENFFVFFACLRVFVVLVVFVVPARAPRDG